MTYIGVPPQGVPGDFNDDDKVDAADYVVWRKHRGTMTMLPNDNGLGGTVGTAHFDLWRTNFGDMLMPGGGSGGQSAVPEPTTVMLLGTAMLALFPRHRANA